MNIDYEKLLIKYIKHVDLAEGSNFIDHCFMPNNHCSEVEFTEEEIKALKKAAEQSFT